MSLGEGRRVGDSGERERTEEKGRFGDFSPFLKWKVNEEVYPTTRKEGGSGAGLD